MTFSILEGLLNTLGVYFDVKLQVLYILLLPVFNQDLLTVEWTHFETQLL